MMKKNMDKLDEKLNSNYDILIYNGLKARKFP